MTSVILKLHSESESRSVVSESLWSHGLQPARSLCPWNSPGQNIGVGSRSILQEIFQTQGLNPGLPHCKWILYHLSHQGSPRILEWKVYLFSRGSSQPRNQTTVSCIARRFFFTSWAILVISWHYIGFHRCFWNPLYLFYHWRNDHWMLINTWVMLSLFLNLPLIKNWK